MINSKIEKLIFIIVFIVLYLVTSVFIAEIKATNAPINSNLSPEEVIQKELPIDSNDTYQYEIINNSIIVLHNHVESSSSYLYIGAKTPNSGFMFNVPSSLFSYKPKIEKYLTEPDYLRVQVRRKINDYVVKITNLKDYFEGVHDINIINQDGQSIKKYENEGAKGEFWVDVLEYIPEDYQLFAEQDNEKKLILDATEIFSCFGGQE